MTVVLVVLVGVDIVQYRTGMCVTYRSICFITTGTETQYSKYKLINVIPRCTSGGIIVGFLYVLGTGSHILFVLR